MNDERERWSLPPERFPLRPDSGAPADEPDLEPARPQIRVITFALGRGVAAFRLDQVAGSSEVPAFVRLPRSPAWLRGLFNRRGEVTPLVDLELLAGADRGVDPRTGRLLVLERGSLAAGCLVHRLAGMRSIAEEELTGGRDQPASGSMPQPGALDHLGIGSAWFGVERGQVLDADRLLQECQRRLRIETQSG